MTTLPTVSSNTLPFKTVRGGGGRELCRVEENLNTYLEGLWFSSFLYGNLMFVVGSNCSGSRETVIPTGKCSILEQNASLFTLTILLKRQTFIGDKTDLPLLPPQSSGSMLQLPGIEKPEATYMPVVS